MDYEQTRILILGLAREGISLAHYFAERGATVTVTDSAPAEMLRGRTDKLAGSSVRLFLGGDYPELVGDADRFFVSPGVPESSPVYLAARERGMRIESMTTLFFELCPAPIVGVTGSSGKTTTTSLIGHILATAERDVVVGGNIGDPMLDLLPKIQKQTTVVLELSSFQLDLLRTSPHIAVVTNISPNHLDRHGSMDAYIAAKRHILEHQNEDDFAVLNAQGAEVRQLAMATPARKRWFSTSIPREGAGLMAQQVCICRAGSMQAERIPVLSLADIPLVGSHNVENVIAAVATTDILDVPPAVMGEAIRTFKPPPHRLQIVGRKNGVTYIDDSIATSPARAVVALQAFSQPIVLIAGGRDKHLPWNEFAYWAASDVRALILIGEATSLIEDAVSAALERTSELKPGMIRRCDSLEAAVAEASRLARPGDIVLLSPGCTSYDMFSNFEERGDAFSRAVEALYAA
jgi:UDP-N-acetylmuramoylalanine--D-glutamate ligase